jgi:HNH endonuclease
MAIGTVKLRNKVWQAYSKRCHLCQEPVGLSEMDLDHLLPHSKGGTEDWRNLAPAHARCNRSKGNVVTHDPVAGQLPIEGIGKVTNAAMTVARVEHAAREWIVRTLMQRHETDSGVMQEWVEFLRDGQVRAPYTNSEYVALWTRLGKELGVQYVDRDGAWVVRLRPQTEEP